MTVIIDGVPGYSSMLTQTPWLNKQHQRRRQGTHMGKIGRHKMLRSHGRGPTYEGRRLKCNYRAVSRLLSAAAQLSSVIRLCGRCLLLTLCGGGGCILDQRVDLSSRSIRSVFYIIWIFLGFRNILGRLFDLRLIIHDEYDIRRKFRW